MKFPIYYKLKSYVFLIYLNMLKEFKYDIDFEKLIKIMIMNNIPCTAQKSE